MGKFKDITGERFGRLVAIRLASAHHIDGNGRRQQTKWECRCDCGVAKVVSVGSLTSGATKSCGCFNVDSHTRHGLSRHHLYDTWHSMRKRCSDESYEHYNRYGGRGITMHAPWFSDAKIFIEHVLSQLGDRPSKKHTIDRIDNDRGYEPGNIRWATVKEQQNNRSTNRFVEYEGVTKTLSQWCDLLGLEHDLVWQRLKRGWDATTAFTKPRRVSNRWRRV